MRWSSRALLERLILLAPGGLIRLEDVLAHTQLEGSVSPTGLDATLRQARAKFERDYIAAVLQQHRGRIADAARVLGIQRTNLYRKMRRLNLTRPKAAGAGLVRAYFCSLLRCAIPCNVSVETTSWR